MTTFYWSPSSEFAMPIARGPRSIAASQFKAKCLGLMDEVQRTGAAIVVTKHGKAIVKIVPLERHLPSAYGCMAGTSKVVGDIVGPAPEIWAFGPDPLDET